LVPEGRRQRLGPFVVSSETVNSGFNENQSELRILVSSVLLHVLSDRDGLLDEVVQVFWDLWCKALGLEDSEDLGTSERVHGGNTLGVSQTHTNLGWGQTLLCQLVDLVLDIISCVEVLEPTWGSPHVWLCRLGDPVSGGMHSTHGEAGRGRGNDGRGQAGNKKRAR
jgi:hypothetical protein